MEYDSLQILFLSSLLSLCVDFRTLEEINWYRKEIQIYMNLVELFNSTSPHFVK